MTVTVMPVWLRYPAGAAIRRVGSGGPTRATACGRACWPKLILACRSEEHTSELQSLMRSSYAVFCLKKKTNIYNLNTTPYSMYHYAMIKQSHIASLFSQTR